MASIVKALMHCLEEPENQGKSVTGVGVVSLSKSMTGSSKLTVAICCSPKLVSHISPCSSH